jgi:hypothetical protein
MFFKKFQQQNRQKIIKTAFITGIFSAIGGFLFSHFLNPKTGEENRKNLNKEAEKAIKYADKTRLELIEKAKKLSLDIKKNSNKKTTDDSTKGESQEEK